jgi:hypothetical protein
MGNSMIKKKSICIYDDFSVELRRIMVGINELYSEMAIDNKLKKLHFLEAPENFGDPHAVFKGNFRGMPFVVVVKNCLYKSGEYAKIVVFYSSENLK